ncbi:hypothetical protein L227DRAFT_617683 [Lentinus tigrinus ALCF2SS1-6]|uniref:Fibronectin type-III domain-containing protein n=1 Tax=Lentinus tigrinus ALCF2SS1-6 TaxID=1328759 RepID=A0A5C2RR17_9APHY|nr:hypothetical protein L227DRAFT_617683 [Lentinus tigrinus ALCF2SS1-6]
MVSNVRICRFRERAHLIKSPSLLLPSGVSTGSIVNIASEISDTFDTQTPQNPKVELRNVTQTSITLELPKVELATAKLRSLDLCRDRQCVAAIPSPLNNNSTKVSGFQLDTEYTFQLVLRTTAGVYRSNVLRVRTHPITDNSGISVCFGNAKIALREMGTKWSNKIQIDTTFTFVANTFVGSDVDLHDLRHEIDAVMFATGAIWPRDLKIPNRGIDGMAQFLVIESLLVLGESPRTITRPTENEPIVCDPIAQGPRYGEARNSLFEFCMRLLPVPTLPKDKLISVLRLIVGLLFQYMKISSGTQSGAGMQSYIAIIVRHVVENQPTLQHAIHQDIAPEGTSGPAGSDAFNSPDASSALESWFHTPPPATPTIIQDTFDLSVTMASPTRSLIALPLTQMLHNMDDDSITTVQAREGGSVDALTNDGIPGQTGNMQIDRGEIPSSTVLSLSQLRNLAMPIQTSVHSTPITRPAQEVSQGVALTPFDTMLGQVPATAAEDTALAQANPSDGEESSLSALGQWLESPSQAHEALPELPGTVNQPSEITARPVRNDDHPRLPGLRGNNARKVSRKAARSTAQLRKARRGGLRRL